MTTGAPATTGAPTAIEGAARVLLCIAPSPAVDRTALVPRIAFGEPLRPTEVVTLPGGKSLNAARVAHRLGAAVVTTGLCGGHAGRWLVAALEHEGLRPRFCEAAAETRTTYVTVARDGRSLAVYEPAAPATRDEFAALMAILEGELLATADWVIVAGAMPAGIGHEGCAAIVSACRRAGRPVLLDSSGAALLAGVEAGVDVVKVGLVEVVAAGAVAANGSAREAAEALVARGAMLAVVTDGRRPVAASDGRHGWSTSIPRVSAVNAVGSGDAFDAGLALGLAAGLPIEAALARGVAAGTANALVVAGGMLDPAIVEELASRVVVRAR